MGVPGLGDHHLARLKIGAPKKNREIMFRLYFIQNEAIQCRNNICRIPHNQPTAR